MSSTMKATSSTFSTPNIKLITDALVDYADITGIDLSKNPFAAVIEHANSPGAILGLLQEREKAFKAYREGNRALISCLSPAVNVIQAFSGILGDAVGLPFPPAKAVFIGIDVLLSAASGVTSSYDVLLDLFERLGNFFKRLEVYTTIPPTPMMTDLIIKIMVESLSVLALATKQIKQRRFKKFVKKLWWRHDIQAALERLDRLTKDEGLSAVAQILGVVHGIADDRRVVMEDEKAPAGGIEQISASNEINKMKRDQLQKDVEHWLSPPDPWTNQNFVSNARHKGTTAWFFESSESTEWKTKGALLWIHGKPGAGKSTLLSAIIQDVEGMHAAGLATMAYYYFDFRDVKKQDCYGLLSSLVHQLSANSDTCYNILSKLYLDHLRGTRKPDINALKKCMTDMLNLLGQGPIYIIVDALDECPNFPGTPSAREEVLKFVEELVGLKLPDVHLCVASRPEVGIRLVLEPLTTLKISLHDEIGQKGDIINYIKSVVRSDQNMRRWQEEDKQLVIDTLSSKADGMFRWIVCMLDRLRRTLPTSIRSVLEDLPVTLDETYGRILLGIDEENREYAQRIFRCLAVSIRPLRVEELAEILVIQFDEEALPTFKPGWRPPYAEEAILSACSSFIAIIDRGGNQVVQFSHFSAKEYLTSERLAAAEERLSYYHILPEPAHTILANVSLSVLLQLDDKIDRYTIAHFPLAPYAARYWVDHAQFRNVSLHIKEVMNRLFDPAKPHFAAWVWLYDIDRYWTERMPTTHPTQPEAVPLYYAALCGFVGLAEHLVVARPIDINSRGGSHTTPLHAASVKGHIQVASLLLENGADPNSLDHLGRVPLHWVSHGGQLVMAKSSLEIARLLVNSGADVNAADDESCAPLHAAAQSGYRELAELLIESGAKLDVRNMDQETPLGVACRSGMLDVSHFLIDCGSDVNSLDAYGFTPLHGASRHGHVGVVRLLLDCGSDVNAREAKSLTPLHQASWYGYLGVAQLLIDYGADVNAQEINRWTALHEASYSGHLDIAKLLIDRGADVDSWNDMQSTPLAFASWRGNLDIARFLIEQGAAVSSRDKEGDTPFHVAAHQGHLHVTKFLLECGMDVDIQNRNGRTPLYLASMNRKLNVVRFLMDQGANIHIRDSNNSNPLHIASLNGHLDVAQLMIETGIPVDVRDGFQKTPLALASSEGKVEVGRFLIHRGADLYVRDDQSQVPLHLASQHGHLDMARLLLDHGVDPDIKRNDLWTPLHLASANDHLKVAELLVQRGASIDVSNDKQETPLYRAVTNGNAAIAHLLIEHGATVYSADSNGSTILHAASRHGHLGVVKLLLRRGADVDVLNNAGRSAAELASENGQAEIAKFIFEYKAKSNIRNKLRSTTLDTTEYGADDDGKDEAKISLHAAAEEGDIDTVRSLLKWRVDINARDVNNQTPLDRAAAKGIVNVVRSLIERGADVDSRDKRGWTPLHQSSQYGHLEVSRVLLDHGANVDAREQDHWTPMHLSTSNGYLEIVKLLLERGADIHAMNDEGETPYHVSLRSGYREIADLLWKNGAGRLGESQGANPNPWSKDQETPLLLASQKGRLEAVRQLLEHSTDIGSQDSLGRTPLHVAAENGHHDIVRLLLDRGEDISARERDRRTPLHLAADQGMFKAAELLLECGAEVDARDKMDRTPLHVASQQGHLDLVRLLLKHNADILALNHDDHTFLDVAWASGHQEIVDINARYEDGQTALHIAAQHGDPEFMRWLIQRKVDPRAEDKDQETPLFPASRNGKLEATRLLLDSGANPNHLDWQEMTPLHGASEKGHIAVTELLLDRGAAVNAEHVYRWTPLHLASQAGKGKAAEVLLGRGATVNAKNDSDWTPLHIASQKGHLDVVKLLLTNDADVNIQNENGETALHLAAFYGHFEVTQVLVEKYADLCTKNNEGQTALILASKESHFDTAQLLRQTAWIRELRGEPVLEQQVGERRMIAQ